MTAGKVSDIAFSVNVADELTAPKEAGNGNEFKKVMESFSEPSKKASPISKKPEVTNGRVRDEINNSLQKQDEPKDDAIVSELIENIKGAIKATLSISDEELEKIMSEIGIGVVDLLNPQNIAMIVARVNEIQPVEILTDEKMTDVISDINSQINEIIKDFAKENNITFDAVVNKIRNVADKEMPVADNETKDNVLSDEPQTEVVYDKQSLAADNDNTPEFFADSKKNQHAASDKSGDSKAVIDNITTAVNEVFSQNVEEVQGAAHVDGADVVRQIVDAVRVRITDEIQSMEINLNPEHLGKINLTVAAKDGVITATITASSEQTKNAIENQLTMLKEQLNNQGIKVEEVEVTVASHSFDSNMMNNSGNDGTDNKSNARRKFRGEEEIGNDTNDTPEEIISEGNINIKA